MAESLKMFQLSSEMIRISTVVELAVDENIVYRDIWKPCLSSSEFMYFLTNFIS